MTRIVRGVTGLALTTLVACSPGPASPSIGTVTQAVSGSFGTFVTVPVPDDESIASRCLQPPGGGCFSAASLLHAAAAAITFPSTSRFAANTVVRASDLTAAGGPLPAAPTNLEVFIGPVTGGNLTFTWTKPAGSGLEVIDYLFEAGSMPGASDVASLLSGISNANPGCFGCSPNGTRAGFVLAVGGTGTFYARIRAVTSGGVGPPSNEVVVTLTGPALPAAPFITAVTVDGTSVTIQWDGSSAGGAVTTYIIQASSTRGGPPNLANFSTGNTATTLRATNVPAGTYFIRVLAANSAGVSPPSFDVPAIVPADACVVAPNSPGNLVPIVAGATVTLGWSPAIGPLATSFVVEAGSASGLSNLASFETGSRSTTVRVEGVARGIYYVRVRARNACGLSPASNDMIVVVQ